MSKAEKDTGKLLLDDKLENVTGGGLYCSYADVSFQYFEDELENTKRKGQCGDE